MSRHRRDSRFYMRVLRELVHPPITDHRFWLIQLQVGVAFVIYSVADHLQHQGVIAVPGFVWALLLFIPLIYAGTTFGFTGSVAVAIEGFAFVVPHQLLLRHTATQLWAGWSILITLLAAALVLGDRFERERELRAELLTAEHQRTVSTYENHPLFGEHLLAMLPDGVTLVDGEGVIRYANAVLETLAGYGPGELNGQAIDVLVPLRQRATHVGRRAAFAEHPESRPMSAGLELTLQRRNGSEVPVIVALSPYQFNDTAGVVATVRDDSIRRAAERDRVEIEQRFHLAFANNVSGIVIVDLDSRAVAVNDSFCAMLGLTSDELVGATSASVTFPEDRGITEGASARMLSGGGDRMVYTKRYLHRDGRAIWTEVSQSLARDETGEPQYFINSVRDVTDERSLFDRLSHQALHDSLTGLPNRALFDDRLAQALTRVSREGGNIAVFIIDLDEFKDVNDTFGHHVGDDLLVAVARRLESVTRLVDTLSRFGGDEFLYLSQMLTSTDDVETIARRILRVFDEPFHLAEGNLRQTASLGVAISSGGGVGTDLLRDADTALYDAKLHAKGHYALFRPEMHAKTSSRLGLVQELRRSIGTDQLSMHYQPIVDLTTHRVIGVEALMRWNHPEYGPVSPDVFIPLAEQSDLIVDLGLFALHQAVAEAASWRHLDDRVRPGYVAVNLSPRQFQDRDLLAHVRDALLASGLDPSQLVLEITENAVFANTSWAIQVTTALRDSGIVLAIDDFGTGHSSLSYFTLLQPDILKIDRSFLVNALDSTRGELLLQTMLTIGHNLEATVIAEGVETVDQQALLSRLGYQFGQGYLFSPPVSSAELTGVLQHLSVH